MRPTRKSPAPLSVLTLRVDVLANPDWPDLTVLVDGRSPFHDVAPQWRGFDPQEFVGPGSPVLPVDGGRRVAVYRCSCGEAGCGVIAPQIVPSPDGRRVSWVDFRDYTGVFIGPLEDTTRLEGRLWDLGDLHFDREQYVAEVERASRDLSWETPRRRTARLLEGRLRSRSPLLPPDLRLHSVAPNGSAPGIRVAFQNVPSTPAEYRWAVLLLDSTAEDPQAAADDMAQQLLSIDPADWVCRFGGPGL